MPLNSFRVLINHMQRLLIKKMLSFTKKTLSMNDHKTLKPNKLKQTRDEKNTLKPEYPTRMNDWDG